MIRGNGKQQYVLLSFQSYLNRAETNGESGRRQVSSVTVASTAHTGILCWAVYEHVILHWGETSYLSESTW
jgi:hypothetical protein